MAADPAEETPVSDPTFEDRHFMASQAVYEQIQAGQVTDVTAALMDAHLQTSPDEEA